MSAIHGVEGLIKWIKGDEWRNDFDAVFDRHVGPACRSAGVEPEELADIIGDHGMAVLWGCAFEDFVSSGSGERNVADEYLKRRGWKESAGARAYIGALRTSVMSLYEVSDVVVGESFLARDLVRGGELVRVFERSATRSLSQWDRIAARVVTALGKTQISGAVLPFSHSLAEEAVASIERVRKKARAEAGKLAKSLGRNVDEIDFAAVTGLEEVLASSAFIFSDLWLNDALRRSLYPTLPRIENTDGDPLEFIMVHYPLISKAKLPAIRTALDDLPSLWKESDGFWNWSEAKPAPRKAAKRRSTGAETFGATMADDGAIVLGTIELGTKAVTLSVNSEARAARGRAMLEPVLAGLARAPLVERQSIEQMMASSREHSERDIVRLPPDEERSIVHQALTDHYRNTLDEPIPALGNQTPRKAVNTAKGRKKVIAWLKMLENQSAQQRPEDPMAAYDFTWLWRELGVGDERR